MRPERYLKVGQLAAEAGVGVQTLHYYERLGLLPKPERSAANYRRYPPGLLGQVRFIKKAQALGFALEEIKESLTLRRGGRAPCRSVVEIARRHLAGLEMQLAALEEFRGGLQAFVSQWEEETSRPRKRARAFCDLIERLPLPPRTGRPKHFSKSP
ncbi:MAG: heavy metal-responsive transcriptional regulator [Limisphaera sp.]|nr:heavy metal-responsive transcriptional regulator [Limisphaera sp.]